MGVASGLAQDAVFAALDPPGLASKLVVSRSLGSLFLAIYGVYLAFTIITNT